MATTSAGSWPRWAGSDFQPGGRSATAVVEVRDGFHCKVNSASWRGPTGRKTVKQAGVRLQYPKLTPEAINRAAMVYGMGRRLLLWITIVLVSSLLYS